MCRKKTWYSAERLLYMNKFAVQITLKTLLCLAGTAHADSSVAAFTADQKIYQVVLDQVIKHEAPERFVVWDTAIPSETILLPRVPRHLPEKQFTSRLRGLPPILQKGLLEPREHGAASLAGLNVSTDSAALMGFVEQTRFLKLVEHGKSPNGLLAVGLSKVVFDQTASNALVYVESCRTFSETICGGEGFWFVRIGPRWKVKKQAYLWQGIAQPFWEFKVPLVESASDPGRRRTLQYDGYRPRGGRSAVSLSTLVNSIIHRGHNGIFAT